MSSQRVAPTDLPIEECVPTLRAALESVGAAVLQAAPGAGKSTVVPLRLLDESWLGHGRIVMLEPRRLATRATARRMASLLGEDVGDTVGYRTRDEARVGPSTRIEVVTEGILTRRLQRDPSLPGIGVVIFDEVHERNLQSELALALALDVRRGLRPELRVLTMSATLDASALAALLGGPGPPVPVVSSDGRTHPVELRWSPREPTQRVAEATAIAVRRALADDQGDVLVFLAGAGEIHRVTALLGSGRGLPPDVDVRPLFGGLSIELQDAALAPSPEGRRRVVLSTDLAETSLTVEGIRIVIDAGEVRRPLFDLRSGLTRLRTGPNSQASADQRSGRAGRTEPGVAYRLWSPGEHMSRRRFAEPEIRSVDLAGLALELSLWGVSAAELSFLDPPPARRLDEARELLDRLGAIDAAGRPTEIGRAMSELPLHPRLAHMVIRADHGGHGRLSCTIASLLEDRDVLRGHPSDLPVDLEERVRLIDDPAQRHVAADPGSVASARRRTRELERRAKVNRRQQAIDLESCGRVLALAYPDRIAQSIGVGRFRLRGGQRVVTPAGDPLGSQPFLVVAEIGPPLRVGPAKSGNGEDQVRIAAALTLDDLEHAVGDQIESVVRLVWNSERDDLEMRTERRIGALILASSISRPEISPETTHALVDRVVTTELALLDWSTSARMLQERAGFAHRALGEPWPDVSDAALLATIDEWLSPLLVAATRRADVTKVDLTAALRAVLGHHRLRELDQVVPASITVPSGRTARIDYDTEPPSISVKPQEMFGPTSHPCVAQGRVPLAVHLLSPGGRVVQVTSDLPGFWSGTWKDVRRELAGRYPKHNWPLDPTTAEPGGRPNRQR